MEKEAGVKVKGCIVGRQMRPEPWVSLTEPSGELARLDFYSVVGGFRLACWASLSQCSVTCGAPTPPHPTPWVLAHLILTVL